jgi:LPXTG-motif cell wall-anchored protein
MVHGHCHHKALWSMSPEEELLQSAGLQPEVLDSGCCGLAGSFGYEREHHDISMQIGERVLLPKIRQAERDTVIVADGFSCRQQIAHGTSRKAMHTAEVLQMALRSQQTPAALSKKRAIEDGNTQPQPSSGYLGLLLGAGLAAGAGYLLSRRKRGKAS